MLREGQVGCPCIPKPPLRHGDGADHQRQRRVRPGRAKLFLVFCRTFCMGGRWDDFVCRFLLSRTFVPNEGSGLVRVL